MNLKKQRNPYRLREEEMTPEEHELVFPSDDGIDFQWGDKYIKYREVIPGIGGKYWRQNADGSVTEFDPVQKRVRLAIRCLRDDGHRNYKVIKDGDEAVLEFDTEEQAGMAEHFFLDVFWTSRSVAARAEGKTLTIECIMKNVFESTYFPAKA